MASKPSKRRHVAGAALGSLSLALVACATQISPPNADQQIAGPHTATLRLPKTFQFFYNFDPRSWRYETQVSSTQWLEVYETGERSYFNVLTQDTVEDCRGIRLIKDDKQLELFVPDDQCPAQLFKFRFIRGDGPKQLSAH